MPDQHPIFDNPTKSFAKVTCKGTNLKTMTRTFVVSKPENVWWGDAAKDAENIKNAPLVPELLAACKAAFVELCNINTNQKLIDQLDAAITKVKQP